MPPPLTQREKAEALRKLHLGPNVLVLPNAWDVASAKIVEAAGFSAIATTSAGIANALGYPDGQRIPLVEMLASVERIARATNLPVSADLEAGYGSGAEDASRLATALVATGAVGLNLEDGTGDPKHPLKEISQQVEQIRAIRAMADEAGIPLVINARTDLYLRSVGEAAERFAHTVERCLAYRDAGADCLFVPGLRGTETIGALVQQISAPLNVLAVPGLPSIPELQRLGVRRLSFGSGLMRAGIGHVRHILEQISHTGNLESLFDGAISFAELNQLVKTRE